MDSTRSRSRDSKFTDDNMGSATSAEGLFFRMLYAEKDELKEEIK